ncbi:hypothetical protein A3F00_01795 [Candidatus Daviesbacteria bacterium RIFCSPHIGHO2_12_FULL_37_11]|uniref:Pyrroloquinoline quinone-dependent pyranose dehydrogenase beta-propeller domain-containing protein n=1 Tax=Candidatus Daviesbacteria bacterium RIFCSPHIGHO2_12_FULL_37_11 TaxID=1797777 RepID=A0A1F5KDR4_9BACT|nr:MAG: hypothetical protein A3F00_01795 [Candidatus Daviesbacteria bacterium RIFCSPHIGHO2_12_FULL_37_11]OGE45565.1 MAG: hypothetical protein A3B39_05140 [Candidatus Daviesbacteria bacterium RIFCSPLOWO2_01_FULL_37_10]
MQKLLSITFISILVVITLGFLIKNKIGDIRPAIFPPNQKPAPTEQIQPEITSELNLPIDINSKKITIFAKDLGAPRDIELSPGGTLLVSIPSRGKIVVLPGGESILTGLDNPHGIAFYNDKLFVAEEQRVTRYLWDEEKREAVKEKELFNLPKGGNHFTRTIAFDKNGRMFVSIGSTCNVCFEKNPFFASVIVSDADGSSPRVFAKGLRNSVFIAINPNTQELWGTEMGRDFLGDDLPPDEINILRDGQDYGWPVCYGNKIKDTKFTSGDALKATPCEITKSPVYEIAAHSAPLGLTFHENHLYIAYHGSWNRSTPIGYKVVQFDVSGNSISNEQDFITGFINGSEATGRPVDIIFDKEGNMYVSDDKAGVVYKIKK